MSGILNTNGLTLQKSTAQFDAYRIIRHSAALPLEPISLKIYGTGTADLSEELGSVSVTITASKFGNGLTTGSGNDVLIGGNAKDVLSSGAGNDIFIGNLGGDDLDGGSGFDILKFAYDLTQSTISNIEALYTMGSYTTARIEQFDSFSSISVDELSAGGVLELEFANGGSVDLSDELENRNANVHLNIAGNNVTLGGGNDTVLTNDGFDIVDAGAGDDTIYGGLGDDVLNGGAGNDTIVAGVGNDTLIGGDGDDQITTNEFTMNVFGSAGNDFVFGALAGTADGGDDYDTYRTRSFDMTGLTLSNFEVLETDGWAVTASVALYESFEKITVANTPSEETAQVNLTISNAGILDLSDELQGRSAKVFGSSFGNSIKTGNGNDYIQAGVGDSILDGGLGDDLLFGNVGNDILRDASGGGTLDGGDGTDTVDFSGHIDNITATLNGNNYSEFYLNNALAGYVRSIEVLVGGTGDDVLNGDRRSNTLSGNAGDDQISGFDGNDTINGSAGNDILSGGAGNDKLFGGDGNDTLSAGTGLNALDGGNGNDMLIGDIGNDKILGSFGNDTIVMSLGNDTVDGGGGVDVLDFSQLTNGGVDVNLAALSYSANGSTTTFKFVEGAIGTQGDDVLTGAATKDLLSGGAGNDLLYGAAGNDTLTGNSGADTFKFAFDGSVDVVKDFVHSDDTFALIASTFVNFDGSTLSAGAIASDYVLISATNSFAETTDSSHGYILATKSGLYWDEDGNGDHAAVRFAKINNTANLAMDDFFFL